MDAQLMLYTGPRAAEAALLAELERLAERARREPGLLARPVRVVVPSRSLQGHLARALVRAHGAVAGIALQTLHGLAREVLDRCGEALPAHESLYPLLVRRAARREPLLRARFDGLQQGYAVVEAVVSDLLDAGFDESLLEPVEELLGERVARGDALALARAVVRTAVRCQAGMRAEGVGHRSLLLQQARACIERSPEQALPARALLVHGFADATGTATDLLTALVSHCRARVFFDEPPDPSENASTLSGHEFSERLRSCLAGLAAGASEVAASEVPARASIELVAAPGAAAEVRAVAERVQRLLAAGAEPESIAVVSRDLAGYATELRLQLTRLGVPFSGVASPGAPGRAARRARALCALLAAGAESPLDDWFEALGDGALAGPSASHAKSLADLRLAARVLGLRSLVDLADARVPAEGLALPVRQQLSVPAEGTGHGVRLRLAPDRLREHVARARALRSALEGWPGGMSVADHALRLRGALAGALGWAHGAADCEQSCETPILEELERLVADTPRDFPVDRDEFVQLLEKQFEAVSETPLGGCGGGVQILSVMEARARCFDHLFVLGLNRDVFPRPVREDALLSDAVRRPLCELLPELPIKRRGYDEERYLFAQLLASSPEITLSWQFTSDEGRERAPSTLLERLRWARPELEVVRAPALHALPVETPSAGTRSGREQALLAGLHGSTEERQRALRVALAERRDHLHACAGSGVDVPVRELADGRAAVVAEFDRAPGYGPALGPYFGFIGPVRSPADPRASAPYVTALESSARCGWRFVLEHILRLEEAPDPAAELPAFDARGIGSVVHEVLEEIVLQARPPGVDVSRERLASEPFAVAWPDEAHFEALLSRAADAVLRELGIHSTAMRGLLCDAARPLLHRARELEWSDAPLATVLGAECEGVVELGSEHASVRFRADRADAGADGSIVYSDYKTGAPLSTAKRVATRRKHLLDAVARGDKLQAAAYALGSSPAGVGRYVQLGADEATVALDASVSRTDDDVVEAFETASGALLNALASGSLAPRLVEPASGPSPCAYCRVSQACLHGDSGARLRLQHWQSDPSENDAGAATPAPAEAALRAVTQLRAGTLERAHAGETS